MARRHYSHREGVMRGEHHERLREERKMHSSDHYSSGYYEGPEERMRQEREDGSMLSNDYHAIANMPQEPRMMLYEKLPYGKQSVLNDRLTGIDHQMHDDEERNKDEKFPEKY